MADVLCTARFLPALALRTGAARIAFLHSLPKIVWNDVPTALSTSKLNFFLFLLCFLQL
jgi:hypothetical protein